RQSSFAKLLAVFVLRLRNSVCIGCQEITRLKLKTASPIGLIREGAQHHSIDLQQFSTALAYQNRGQMSGIGVVQLAGLFFVDRAEKRRKFFWRSTLIKLSVQQGCQFGS